MTNLKCSVRNCAYNDDSLCCREDIMIGGQDAGRSSETCCESFRERSGNMTNSAKEGTPETSVGCHAHNCRFNEECKCHAGQIGITGSRACCCAETQCASFEPDSAQ